MEILGGKQMCPVDATADDILRLENKKRNCHSTRYQWKTNSWWNKHMSVTANLQLYKQIAQDSSFSLKCAYLLPASPMLIKQLKYPFGIITNSNAILFVSCISSQTPMLMQDVWRTPPNFLPVKCGLRNLSDSRSLCELCRMKDDGL